ncbi:AraC family transcriptional regulator [Oleiphilus messinensis]|uniref:AraC family transcriptional regulator n=1 Tax=Oleiphilus messinensis TaxID=141451 RepID=A0A1Y0ID35_9GAMM|nr:AraC family transcriptional regulator [Oleiphilus messinensis]ARU58437.1 AraC family transcriptional regulator [Oleiphilus messinensis]
MTIKTAPYKVAKEFVQQLVCFAREQGMPVDTVLSRAGIELGALEGQPAYVSGPILERYLAAMLKMVPDPLPGLYASRWRVATFFGLVGFLAQTSSTLGVMLNTLVQVEPLVGDTGKTRIHHVPGEIVVSWHCQFTNPDVLSHASDFILSTFVGCITSAARPGVSVVRSVHLQHAAPEQAELLQRYIDVFGCPVYFGESENRIVLPNDVFDLPLPGADPQLHEMLENHARKLMEERTKASRFVDLVRSRLHQQLQAGAASREALAAEFGMSGRTLHRKLQDDGTSYREILDELRLQRARKLLVESDLSIQQVGELSGFDEGQSFTRWFRQLTGNSPSEFRHRC